MQQHNRDRAFLLVALLVVFVALFFGGREIIKVKQRVDRNTRELQRQAQPCAPDDVLSKNTKACRE